MGGAGKGATRREEHGGATRNVFNRMTWRGGDRYFKQRIWGSRNERHFVVVMVVGDIK